MTESTLSDMSLAELLEGGLFIDGDWIESKDQDPQGEVRLIQLADVGDGVFRDRSSRFLTMAKARELRCTFLEPGDILVARMPEPLGRACIFPGLGRPAVTAVDVCILRPLQDRARPEWLVKAINAPAFRAAMQEFVRGTTRQRISRRNLGTLRLQVPPIDEQAAIAHWLDGVEIKRISAVGHVVAARRAAARTSLAILAAACSGRLTVDWREAHAIPKRLDLVDRRDEVADSDGIPEEWVQATIGDVGHVQLGGTPSRKVPSYWLGHVPWVSSGEVANCRIQRTREFISEAGLANSSAKVYPVGTVLIAMIGEGKTRGQAAILDIEASTNQNAAGIIANHHYIDPEYLWRWALAQYEVTRAVGRGGNQPALNKQKVRDLTIAVPPLEEQAEIVRRVDSILARAAKVMERVETASRRVEHSSQAVLAKTFRGELLPANG
ncbi:MAG: restriction endonuclease subunit S [Actinomycetota bacterium]